MNERDRIVKIKNIIIIIIIILFLFNYFKIGSSLKFKQRNGSRRTRRNNLRIRNNKFNGLVRRKYLKPRNSRKKIK